MGQSRVPEKAPAQGVFSLYNGCGATRARGVYSNISALVPDEAGASPAGSTTKGDSRNGVVFGFAKIASFALRSHIRRVIGCIALLGDEPFGY